MENPLVILARKLALRRKFDVEPTRILPLTSIHKVTVFLDSFDADADPTRRLITAFFRNYDTEVDFICPQKWDINWYGRLKKPRLHAGEKPKDADDDLFISLAGPGNFTAEYEARCSHAKFKVGRVMLPGNVYDIVITDAPNTLPRQTESFQNIKEFLLKIK